MWWAKETLGQLVVARQEEPWTIAMAHQGKLSSQCRETQAMARQEILGPMGHVLQIMSCRGTRKRSPSFKHTKLLSQDHFKWPWLGYQIFKENVSYVMPGIQVRGRT